MNRIAATRCRAPEPPAQTPDSVKQSVSMAGTLRVLLFSLFLGLAACTDGMHDMGHGQFSKKSFASNGERIYFTGVSSSNQPISTTAGHHHMLMHGGGCATCHGENREGGIRMWPWFWETAPALTRDSLLGDHQDDGHTHAVYDVESLKLAITEGINPAGEPLNDLMPRWQMAATDLDDLVAFLLSEAANP